MATIPSMIESFLDWAFDVEANIPSRVINIHILQKTFMIGYFGKQIPLIDLKYIFLPGIGIDIILHALDEFNFSLIQDDVTDSLLFKAEG
jgi:hypothetical protein